MNNNNNNNSNHCNSNYRINQSLINRAIGPPPPLFFYFSGSSNQDVRRRGLVSIIDAAIEIADRGNTPTSTTNNQTNKPSSSVGLTHHQHNVSGKE
jgi:hypothetical protein